MSSSRVLVTDSRTSERIEDKTYQASPLSDHYGADEQMAEDVIAFVQTGAKQPVSAIDALEAGILALAMDEARLARKVVDLKPVWEKFDGCLHGTSDAAARVRSA